eukprot:RCo049447
MLLLRLRLSTWAVVLVGVGLAMVLLVAPLVARGGEDSAVTAHVGVPEATRRAPVSSSATGVANHTAGAAGNPPRGSCGNAFEKSTRGVWVPRAFAEKPWGLFGLPPRLWFRPLQAGCDYRPVSPQEACRCLHKVGFIGDSITLGLAQIFAEFVTQNERIILRKNISREEDKKDCFAAPLYDNTGHIRYKPCLPLMENFMYDKSCDLHVHYLRVNKWVPGVSGTQRELKQFLARLKGVDSSPIDLLYINFGLHHMVAWPDRVLSAYLACVQRAMEILLEATEGQGTKLVWAGITAQHVAKKPPEWRRLQANSRVQAYNNASFKLLRDVLRLPHPRVDLWDPFGMTAPEAADAMSWDGVHYVRHLNTMRTQVLLNRLFEPRQRCGNGK